jgi:quinolinate synthase
MSKQDQELIDRILELKKERNAVILSHNYQRDEVQDIGDFCGDSLELSRRAAETDADVILFNGVHFMAETAAILSPQKTVLIPDVNAGCPMADMIDVEQLRQFKAEHPGIPVVAYVNTTAAVKAECDICCTSANGLKIVESLGVEEILFVPDQSLGSWIASKSSVKVTCWGGYCPTHHRIFAKDILGLKEAHPAAITMAHPECTTEVVRLADQVLSTSQMCRFVRESDASEFIVATEIGIRHRLELENPGKQFFFPNERLVSCPNMKKNTLEKVLWALEGMEPRVVVPEEVRVKALGSIERMLEVR